MRGLRITLLLITLILLPALMPFAQIHAGNGALPSRSSEIIWVQVEESDVPNKLGTYIDMYAQSISYSTAVQLPENAAVFTTWRTSYDLLLNPAPVVVLEHRGNISKSEAAEELGVPELAISYIEYNASNDTTTIELCVAPAEVPDGYSVIMNSSQPINPFCIRELRYAVNYIIDREYISEEILHRYGTPQYTPYSVYNPTSNLIIDLLAKYQFPFSEDNARSIVNNVMRELGAELVNGTWYYKGSRVALRFVIRGEDERRDIGSLVADELENLGFYINRSVESFSEAITDVYFTCPEEFTWHLYTEGWVSGGLSRYDPYTVTMFSAPWYGFMPGYWAEGCWRYKNSTIDELTRALVQGQFRSRDEFVEKLRRAVEIAVQESVRVWIATVANIYVASNEVSGVTLNLANGFEDLVVNARNLFVEGRSYIRIGTRTVWSNLTIWNPYGGFCDRFSRSMMYATWDPLIWYHPFSGDPIPLRASFKVLIAGPDDVLEVPSDALVWNVSSDRWDMVGDGVFAKSVVVLNLSRLLGTQWHDNTTITWADVIGYYATLFEIAYDENRSRLESDLSESLRVKLGHVIAIRPVFENHTLEIYVDYWYFDPAYIAQEAAINIYNPVELDLALLTLAFENKSYALGMMRAYTDGVPQLNMVLPDHAADIRAVLMKLRDRYQDFVSYFTVYGKPLLTEDEWRSRIDAAVSWIDTYGNAWISNGAFKLVYLNVTEQKAVFRSFESPAYPIEPSELYFGIPEKPMLTDIEGTDIVRGRDAVISIVVEGPEVSIGYAVIDPESGIAVLHGTAEHRGGDEYTITIPAGVTSKLVKDEYLLTLAITGKDIALGLHNTAVIYVSSPPTAPTTPSTPALVGGRLVILEKSYSYRGVGFATAVVAMATVVAVLAVLLATRIR